MVLEATMICIDNSEWMRNGDYPPTRFQAQADAVNLICGAKTQSNPENTVGVLTMAGKGVRVLVTPTTDLGKILGCMHGLEIGGEMNLTSGIQVAQLALKHRQNKKQQQRIILFAGSPIKSDKKTLEAIGKKLKKNNVALDIVDFGEEDDGKPEKLEALLAAVNSSDNSHIVHVPVGPNALSDVLLSSPIFTGDGEGGSGFAAAAAAGAAAAAAAAAAGGASAFEFGVDPNLDPELALALRVSMEEERARQEAAAKRAAEEAATKATKEGHEQTARSLDVTMAEPTASAGTGTAGKGPDLMDDETTLLEQALAMSMDNPGTSHSSGISIGDTNMAEASHEDQDLAYALRMSVQEDAKNSSGNAEMSKVLGDQGFVSSILASLPGVDPNDPSVKDLLASLQGEKEEGEVEVFGIDTKCSSQQPAAMAMAFRMATTGMGISEECRHLFMELKRKKVHRYIVFKIDEKSKQVLVDKTGGPTESYDDFTASLPENDCRYAVFDFDFVTVDNCQKSKIFFISWSPAKSRIRAKMLYATSKDRLRRELDGVHYELQATDPSEMDIGVIRDRAN